MCCSLLATHCNKCVDACRGERSKDSAQYTRGNTKYKNKHNKLYRDGPERTAAPYLTLTYLDTKRLRKFTKHNENSNEVS